MTIAGDRYISLSMNIAPSIVSTFKQIYRVMARLTRADMAFFILMPLMVLLIVGTVAQKHMGLYAAHKMFFSSFVFWWGFVSFPGGYSLIGLLSLFLALKFFLKSKWSWRKSGIVLAHFGALFLLFGGLITSIVAQESFMVIPEGDKTPYVYAYTDKQMSVYRDNLLYMDVPFEDLLSGFELYIDDTILSVVSRCLNCEIISRAELSDDDSDEITVKHLAEFMALIPRKPRREAEENLSGLSFDLQAEGNDAPYVGRYIAFDAMPKPIQWRADGHDYIITFGKVQRELPFAIKLIDFQEDLYPGEQKAKRFHSDIVVMDGKAQWPARIEMNKPLRYKGYTFYQSSFERDENGAEMTVLSVVKNKGRLVPYIGTGLLALGLLLHCLILMRRSKL